MQFVLTLDWVSVVASLVAFFSLGASVFSAIGAARSADVARSAEERIRIGERSAALRELMRSAAHVKAEARLVITLFENASRTAIANADCYSTPEKKMQFLQSSAEFQKKISEIQLANHCEITTSEAMTKTDSWIAQMQLDLDQKLAELLIDKTWATMRAEQLSYVNRSIAEDVTAAERSRGIYVRQDSDGLLV